MNPKRLLLPAVVIALLALYSMRASGPKCSGISFDHAGGDCLVWYARDGDQILDMVIAPRATFAASYNAASSRLRVGDDEIPFGSARKAYIFDANAWRILDLDGLSEPDLPDISELERCASTSEIAQKILGK
jgi:hypothetical protein